MGPSSRRPARKPCATRVRAAAPAARASCPGCFPRPSCCAGRSKSEGAGAGESRFPKKGKSVALAPPLIQSPLPAPPPFPFPSFPRALPFSARPAPGRKDEVLPGREGHEVGLVGHCVDDLRSPTITRVPTPFPRGAPPRSCACSKLVGCCPLAWPGAPPVGFYLAYYHWTSINRSLSMHMGEILIVRHPT